MIWWSAAIAGPPIVEGEPYLLEMRVVTSAKIPFAGKREVVTVSHAAVRFERDRGAWMQRQVPCDVDVEGGRVSFPDAFVDHLQEHTAPVEWSEDGGYRFDPGPSFVGVPEGTEDLPKAKDDPMLIDHDGDGKPGATVHLSLPVFGNVELYLVQASHGILTGRSTPEGLAGEIEIIRLDQTTLGASIGVFAVSPKVELVEGGATWSLVPDREERCSSRLTTLP